MRKSMNAKVISALGLLISLAACGDDHSATVPPGLPDAPAPKNVIEPKNALTVTDGTSITGPSVLPASLDLAALKGTSWSSDCYRFGDKGDYSKKFWSFGDGAMNSLLLKYKDAACTQVTPPTKPYAVWDISSITVSGLSDDWSVVKATCTSAVCTAPVDVAFRVKEGKLYEGGKNTKAGGYYIGDTEYVVLSKADVSLDKLAADANKAAPGNTTTPNKPTTPTQPTTPVSTADATGLADLSALAGKTFESCVVKKGTNGASDTSRKAGFTFIKGTDLGTDGYQTTNTNFTTADCSGTGTASTPWKFTNVIVKKADIEGWIYMESRTCEGAGCKVQKALYQAVEQELKIAGSKTGGFYTETPNIYKLVP